MGRKISTTIGRLIPNAIEVKNGDESVIVAVTADENKILNYFLAAKIRQLLESNIQKYKESEATLTPRELKDLADAGKSLAEFSATLYKEADPLVTVEKVQDEAAAPNFDKLNAIEVNDKLNATGNVGDIGKETGLGFEKARGAGAEADLPATDLSTPSGLSN